MKIITSFSLFIVSIGYLFSQSTEPVIKGPYFGQKEPGLTPELFAPEIMNAEMGYHSTIVFSPDMKEAFWSPMERGICLMHSKLINGIWTKHEYIDFGLKGGAGEATFSFDGNKLLFLSTQPPKEGDSERERIWFVEKATDGWSKPKIIDGVILTHPTHWTFSVAKNGNLYFTSEKAGVRGEQDIYVAKFDGKNYLMPYDLGDSINTDGKELASCIAPDESFLIFTRIGKDTEKTDLYISFRRTNGSWTKAIDMGPRINSEYHDLCASLSPDGKYLFFLSQREGKNRIYWVSTKVIEELGPKEL